MEPPLTPLFLVAITMKQNGDNFHFYLTDYKMVRGMKKRCGVEKGGEKTESPERKAHLYSSFKRNYAVLTV
jgi:hypothetical protein